MGSSSIHFPLKSPASNFLPCVRWYIS